MSCGFAECFPHDRHRRHLSWTSIIAGASRDVTSIARKVEVEDLSDVGLVAGTDIHTSLDRCDLWIVRVGGQESLIAWDV